MSKVFLYLYPIKEFADVFTRYMDIDDHPFEVLNDTINERYRKKGYNVVYAIYPDKKIYGINPMPSDAIITTDINFSDVEKYYKYPNEAYLINQIGSVEELVVSGYHALDCVKRVAESALEFGINSLVDLDLTDLFFDLYKHKEYFQKEIYSPERFKEYLLNRKGTKNLEFIKGLFNRNYNSPVYGFDIQNYIKGNSK